MKYYNVYRNGLIELYNLMADHGAGIYAKGHYVLVSIFFFADTLDYCLNKTKDYFPKDENFSIAENKKKKALNRMMKEHTIMEIVERCYQYFKKNEQFNIMKYLCLILIIASLFLSSCSTVRKSAGVTRKSIDEFKVVENPPLVIPPDFNLLPPEQLEKKNIDDVETELAQEILFGLDENLENNEYEKLSIMNQILESTEANSIDSSIRNEIDEQFANEIKTDSIYQTEWESEIEVLDAIKESERIRNQLIQGKSIAEGEVPTIIQKTKKKKKRFFFF